MNLKKNCSTGKMSQHFLTKLNLLYCSHLQMRWFHFTLQFIKRERYMSDLFKFLVKIYQKKNFIISCKIFSDSVIVSSITTPGLLIACCNLVLNLMTKEKSEVANLASSQGFILELFRYLQNFTSQKKNH